MIYMSGGTIPGLKHRRTKTNNQDSMRFCQEMTIKGRSIRVAIVSDGCGSGSDSYVGSQNTVRWLCDSVPQLIAHSFERNAIYNMFLRYIEQQVQAYAEVLRQLGEYNLDTIRQYTDNCMRASIVMMLIIDEELHFLWKGDGFYALNGNITELDAKNHPAYPVYALPIYRNHFRHDEARAGFEYLYVGKDWQNAAVMTDGGDALQRVIGSYLVKPLVENFIQQALEMDFDDGLIQPDDDVSLIVAHKVQGDLSQREAAASLPILVDNNDAQKSFTALQQLYELAH